MSRPTGHLTVTWHVIPGEPPAVPRLHVDWRETGVTMDPTATPRLGGGYGRELIERALPYQLGAVTSYRFTDDGVHCTIEVDVPQDRVCLEKANG